MVARFVVPERQELWWWALVAGRGPGRGLRPRAVAQRRRALFQRRQARYGTLAASGVVLGLAILVAANYILARQNKRWDLTAAQQYSLSDQTVRVLESLEVADPRAGVRPGVRLPALPRPARRVRVHVGARCRWSSIDVDKQPGAGAAVRSAGVRHRRVRLQRPHRAGGLRPGAGPDQRADQGRGGRRAQGVLPAGPRRAVCRPAPSATATARWPTPCASTTCR